MENNNDSNSPLETSELLTFMHQLWSEVDQLLQGGIQFLEEDNKDYN